jgi:capsular polysaccharide biosynthesis protein
VYLLDGAAITLLLPWVLCGRPKRCLDTNFTGRVLVMYVTHVLFMWTCNCTLGTLCPCESSTGRLILGCQSLVFAYSVEAVPLNRRWGAMNAEQWLNTRQDSPGEDEPVFPLGEILQVVWQRLWIIVLTGGVLVGAAVGFSLAQTPSYEASTMILIGQQKREALGSLGSEVVGLQQITQTMAQAVPTRPVAEAAIREQNLKMAPERLLEDLTVEQIAETQFIEVVYRDTSPKRAQQVANTIGEVFTQRVSEVSPNVNGLTATVWEPAVVPGAPVSPDPLRNGLVALVAGLVLGVALAFLMEHLDDSWRSPEEAEQIVGRPVLAVIPAATAPKKETKG